LVQEATLITRDGVYVVEVFGNAMEPRYFAGEVVYVDPHQAASSGDFVVAQIQYQGEGLPRTHIKRLVSFDDQWLTLDQYNPKQSLSFPSRLVVSIHPIVLAGKRQRLA
jgi:phage repressor protein C with HTH and peptisase S24 domain